MTCRQCGHPLTTKRAQPFKNGSTHIREECAQCGAFIKWHKQDNSTFREKLWTVVRNLSYCETQEGFLLLKAQAHQLMMESQNRHVALRAKEQMELP